jgi:hypothetical protein
MAQEMQRVLWPLGVVPLSPYAHYMDISRVAAQVARLDSAAGRIRDEFPLDS